MSTSRNLAVIIAIWAAIYLPWLGTPELRSEEGHRVLPAVEMLESRDFLVPHIGGQPYLAKPPLVNWQIAAAFWLSGVRNEWTARLPSALHVLAAAIVIATVSRNLLGNGAIVAAIAWLTNLGMIEKGRMAEIDAIYVSLFAIAFVCWLALWIRHRSPWLTWTLPWLFLGLAMLAKGPAHLIFFYALVVATLWRTERLRQLVHPAHAIGLLLMLTIFAAWALPCLHAFSAASLSQTWKYELLLRVTGGENAATDWPMNFPRGFGYFLPWLIVLPFIRIGKLAPADRAVAVGLAIGAAIPFVVILLLPGTIPRYILPALVPVCLLIGLAVRHNAFAWPFNGRYLDVLSGGEEDKGGDLRNSGRAAVVNRQVSARHRSVNMAVRAAWSFIAFFIVVSAIVFAARSATTLKNHPKIRPIAERVNAFVPSGEPLFAVKPLFQPYLFYVHAPIRYLNTIDDLPAQARFFITGPTERPNVNASKADLLLQTAEYRGHSTSLFRVK